MIYKTLEELGYNKSYFLKGEIKTSEIYKDSPIQLVEDTMYSMASTTSLNVEILDAKKYKISFMINILHIIKKYLYIIIIYL